MSRAFVKEGEEQELSDVAPSMNALINFLSRQNNYILVTEKKCYRDAKGQEIHEMSNGLSYSRDDAGKWMVAKEKF